MILIKIKGGLGNQMFQYALGINLSRIHKTPLKLDITSYENDPLRDYTLKYFNIENNLASQKEIDYFEKYKKFFWSLLNKFDHRYVEQKKGNHLYFHFNSDILRISDNTYLDGYWQSEKYFYNAKDIIKKQFTLKKEFSDFNSFLAEDIKNKNSVSLHFRRKDYINDKNTLKVHGICSFDYYTKAIRKIVEKVNNPYFFIFSDDPDWVKKNFNIKYQFRVISGDDYRDYQELALMSLCKHHIIANSSFSWWGAWLSSNERKIIIAPEKWLADPQYNMNDIIPDSWIKI